MQKLGLYTRKLLLWLGQRLFLLLLFLLSAGYWSRTWFLLLWWGREALQLQAASRPYLCAGKRVPEEGGKHLWGLKIELACRRVERGAGGDATPLPAPCLVLLPGQDLAAGETPARCPAWQQCPGAVPWVTPSQQSCPGSPQPVQPRWLMLKPAAATGPGLPRLRDLMDMSHPVTAVGQAVNVERREFLVSLSILGCLCKA